MKVLIVGLGSIAKRHIAALRLIDSQVQLYALRSSQESKSWDGIVDLYSWNDLCRYQFDFVIISNPTSEHISTIRCLNSKVQNLPLFIEKPLDKEPVNKALIQEIDSLGQITYVACNLRFHECLRSLKKIVEKERINEVNIYCGSYLPEWRPGVDYRKVYSAIPKLGGGVHIDLIHEVDYCCWLFGMPQRSHSLFTNKSSLNIQAYDYANYIFEYSGYNASIVLNYFRRDYKRTAEVVCENATYLADLPSNTITCNGSIVFHSDKLMTDTYYDQMLYFVNCVKKNQDSFNNLKQANDILKICI